MMRYCYQTEAPKTDRLCTSPNLRGDECPELNNNYYT